MKKSSIIAFLPVCVLLAGWCLSPVARGGSPAVGLGLKAGTVGIAGDVTLRMLPSLNLRLGYAALPLDVEPSIRSNTDDDLKVSIDLRSAPLLADWHPTQGRRFRLSTGLVVNHNRILMTAGAGYNVRFDEYIFRVDEARGSVTFNRYAPYIGIGYGNAVHPESRWNFVFDLGVMYHGKPKIYFQATAADPRVQPALDQAVEAEVEDIRETTDKIQFYPVLALGLSCRF